VTKRKSRTTKGKLYVSATFNNTIVTITDDNGKVLDWVSCGAMGFKGTRKSTPFAATTTLKEAIERLQKLGIKELEIYLKGPGSGRDAALRVLRGLQGVNINMISDITPIPHNGPRPPKERRV
jgi:small subunit ribosomal protein S11